MKPLYIRVAILSYIIATFFLLISYRCAAQCPHGYVPSGVAFDTTINFSSGRVFAELKFPKFDPQVGMVTCARLTMEMSATMENLSFENRDFGISNTATADFTRKDTLSGPGLSSPLLNSESHTYGPYTLGPRDLVNNSGPDYVQVGPESIFTKSVSTIITNAADLAVFYGPVGDSLVYNYSVDSKTQTSVTGNWFGGAETSGSVTYRLEYCYCPVEILPVNAYDFKVKKISKDKAELSWNGAIDPSVYYYEVEYSTDGRNFTGAGIVEKQTTGSASITYNYLFTKNDFNETYYFRVKQRFPNGKALLTDTKSIHFDELDITGFSLFPNPSNGIIGIKFDKNISGKILVVITNPQGQIVFNRQIEISDNNYRQVTALQRGMYWVKVTDVAGQRSYVNQLFIK
ncbi:MAG: choice-of-anchor E domain-containing protein [Bacteroidetes bacterium]|nr:choice-of-anchor E domain-containing protein [Bacteroidota bacterium]